MSEKPLFCHASPARGLCLCCPQLSQVMLALNTPRAEHPLALPFLLGIEFLAIQSLFSLVAATWGVKRHVEQWLRGFLGFTRQSQCDKLSLSIALKGTWLSQEFRGNVVPGCSLGVSHALSTMSRTKHPKQEIPGVRKLLAGDVVPFQKDVLTVAADVPC